MKKNPELELLSRYQRRLLFGGAFVLSLAIIAVGCFAIYSTIDSYITYGRTIYLTNKSQLMMEIESLQNYIREEVLDAEAHWDEKSIPSLSLSQKRKDSRGVYIGSEGKNNLSYVVLNEEKEKQFLPLMALTEWQLSARGRGLRETEEGQLNYFFNPQHSYLSILPFHSPDEIPSNIGSLSAHEVIEKLTLDSTTPLEPQNKKFSENRRNLKWSIIEEAPVTGQKAVQVMQPAFKNGKLFATFLINYSSTNFSRILKKSFYGGTFMIIDGQGKLIYDEWYDKPTDPSLAERVLNLGTWKENLHHSGYTYRDGTFTISEPLSNTGWILAYSYSWKTIIATLWRTFAFYFFAIFFLSGLLWSLVYFFDIKIFSPLLIKSQRVFESEDLNNTIISNAPFGLGLLSLKNADALLQNAVMQAYQYDGKPLTNQLWNLYHSHVLAPSKDQTNNKFELTATLNDQQRHLQVNIIKSKYQGQYVLMCGFTDITIRKTLEETLLKAQQAADNANRAKSSFIAMMSHEIRTPLHGVLGNLELLSRSKLSNKQSERLKRIFDASRRLLNMLNGILDFSKVEAEELTLEIIPFDLLALVEEVLADFSPQAQLKNLYFFHSMTPTMHQHFCGDPTRIKQVIINLVSNAFNFTEHGFVGIYLWLEDIEGRSFVCISVKDTGIGIDISRHKMIFTPFVQADHSTTRIYGGTGLGLALCKSLVEMMNGDISIDSEEGKGTQFTVRLPLESMMQEDVQPTLNVYGRKIYLLSSEDGWHEAIAPHLKEMQWHVIETKHPDECVIADIPVIIYGRRQWLPENDILVRQNAKWVIDAHEDGPREASSIAHGILISCYSLTEFKKSVIQLTNNAALIVKDKIELSSVVEKSHKKSRILVVEDHLVNMALMREQLEILGYYVRISDNASEALILFHQEKFDIVLTDLGMPVIDGLTFTKILRQQGVTVPVIAITADISSGVFDRCGSVGINEVLVKPFLIDDLEKVLFSYQLATSEVKKEKRKSTQKKLIPVDLFKALQDASNNSIAAMKNAIEHADFSVLEAELHSIKGAFATQHQEAVVKICVAAQLQCEQKDLAGVSRSVDQLTVSIERSLATIKSIT